MSTEGYTSSSCSYSCVARAPSFVACGVEHLQTLDLWSSYNIDIFTFVLAFNTIFFLMLFSQWSFLSVIFQHVMY